jgi:EPS-associated MarR family transcriptional regulator
LNATVPNPADEDFSFELLRRLAREPDASQRNIARRLGVSVGKVNYCLRALIDKGWIKTRNFRRSDNKLAYAYLLTPSGASAKVKLARAFLVRKLSDFERLQSEIDALRREVSVGAGTERQASSGAEERERGIGGQS